MSAIFTFMIRRVVAVAFLLTLLTTVSSRADWSKLAGNYTGAWKSSDSGGMSYSGTATLSIKGGPGNSLTITLKTTFLGNPILAKGKAPANGKLKVSVNNIILGTVTGVANSKAGGTKGTIKGTVPLYDGTATADIKLSAGKGTLKANGTLVRAFPMVAPMTLTYSFVGKKK
ncbi:MAG: hypothetical protein ACREKL_15290 [Chthoniobacterales bacterium]